MCNSPSATRNVNRLQGPERKADATLNAKQNRDGDGAAADEPSAAPPAQNGKNEPEPVAVDARPPERGDSLPLPSPHKLSRAEAARENGRKFRNSRSASGGTGCEGDQRRTGPAQFGQTRRPGRKM